MFSRFSFLAADLQIIYSVGAPIFYRIGERLVDVCAIHRLFLSMSCDLLRNFHGFDMFAPQADNAVTNRDPSIPSKMALTTSAELVLQLSARSSSGIGT